MSKLYIFDKYDNLLTILSNDSDKACPFWDAPYEEELNKGETFEFTIPGDHDDAVHVVPGNQVAFKDRDGDFRLFWIRELDEEYEDSIEKRWICEAGFLENNGESVDDIRAYDTTALHALTRVLTGMRWQQGNVADLGINSTSFYMISVTKSIETILNTWGGELKTRITVADNKITGRYIDILPRRGADTGKRWVAGKDIVKHRRTILHYPVTALTGRGKGVESGDGYGRRITFENVVWSVSNGDPVDKPLGQIWVGDPNALQLYGIPNPDGSLRHVKGFFDDSEEEDAAKLLQSTWADLQRRNKPIEQYDLSVILLEKLTGYEHEKVRLGDTTYAINRKFKPEITTEQRVVRFKYYIDDPSDERAEVTLGDVIPLFTDDERIAKMEAKLNDFVVDTGPVTDTSFPDTIPPVPTNFTATGLFKTLALEWDYDPSSYIAAYEVYASQVAGFSPDASNLVFRGKVGGYVHKADTNQQWYFRIRAINTHGTVSDFTAETNANTVTINAETDIQPLTITNELIAENAAIDFAKIANVEITNAMIKELDAAKLKAGSVIASNVIIKGELRGATGTFTGSVDVTGSYGNAKIVDGRIHSNDGDSWGYLEGGTLRLGSNSAKTSLVIDPTYGFIWRDDDVGPVPGDLGEIKPKVISSSAANMEYYAYGGRHVFNTDINFNNGALISNDGGSTNLDHIWHDDSANAWHFVSDKGYKSMGNSTLVSGGMELVGNDSVQLKIYADLDNVDENGTASILFSQDGKLTEYTIGIDTDNIFNITKKTGGISTLKLNGIDRIEIDGIPALKGASGTVKCTYSGATVLTARIYYTSIPNARVTATPRWVSGAASMARVGKVFTENVTSTYADIKVYSNFPDYDFLSSDYMYVDYTVVPDV